MSDVNLITSHLFQGRDHLVKMGVGGHVLEICVTDKQTAEEWHCSYDQAYIENLTHKTGNFKQFDIFATMLKSGLLQTSESISLDLLNYDDLEALRVHRIKSHSWTSIKQNSNRRYLILKYDVEFDRILYPLPLEYCGPPDPTVLQSTIRRLEAELTRTKKELEDRFSRSDGRQVKVMQKRIDDLMSENVMLHDEIRYLSRGTNGKSRGQIQVLQNAINHLEQSVLVERRTHHKLVEKLRQEKVQLFKEIERLKSNNLKSRFDRSRMPYSSPNRTIRPPPRNKSSAQMIYRTNSPVNIPNINLKPSRSPSPRKARSEGWNNISHPRNDLHDHMVHRPTSRCSSASSHKYSDAEDHVYNTKRPTRQQHQRKNQHGSSRSSSVSSQNSTARKSHSLRMKMKNSDDEFKSLEHRINSLQQMLQGTITK